MKRWRRPHLRAPGYACTTTQNQYNATQPQQLLCFVMTCHTASTAFCPPSGAGTCTGQLALFYRALAYSTTLPTRLLAKRRLHSLCTGGSLSPLFCFVVVLLSGPFLLRCSGCSVTTHGICRFNSFGVCCFNPIPDQGCTGCQDGVGSCLGRWRWGAGRRAGCGCFSAVVGACTRGRCSSFRRQFCCCSRRC